MLQNLTSHDLAKDSLLAAFGFVPSVALTQVHVALIVGLLNIIVVIIFRVTELRRRDRRDLEAARLRSRIAVLEAGKRSPAGEAH